MNVNKKWNKTHIKSYIFIILVAVVILWAGHMQYKYGGEDSIFHANDIDKGVILHKEMSESKNELKRLNNDVDKRVYIGLNDTLEIVWENSKDQTMTIQHFEDVGGGMARVHTFQVIVQELDPPEPIFVWEDYE